MIGRAKECPNGGQVGIGRGKGLGVRRVQAFGMDSVEAFGLNVPGHQLELRSPKGIAFQKARDDPVVDGRRLLLEKRLQRSHGTNVTERAQRQDRKNAEQTE